jgi:RNA polymerase sigma-B factor
VQDMHLADEVLLPAASAGAGPAPATRAERQQRTRELLSRAGATSDLKERELLLEAVVVLNMGVARNLAAGFAGRGIARDDLEQVAYLALTRLVRRYDPNTEADFLAYAVPTIRGELKKYFRDHGWTIRPPRRIQEIQTRVISERAHLTQRLGREPALSELAEATGEDMSSVREALSADGCFQPTSLDRLVGGETATTLGELLDGGTDQAAQQAVEARVELAPVIRRLSERDRRILHLRYFCECTQQEIAKDIGVSQMQVSRMLTRIIRDIRRGLPGALTDRQSR